MRHTDITPFSTSTSLITLPIAGNKRSFLDENNISFSTINKWYQEHFGDITPFQHIVKDNTELVFNENLVYKDVI